MKKHINIFIKAGFLLASLLTFMNAAQARFLSIDPAPVNVSDPMSFNRYAYANNNPYRYIDPDGRATCANTDCSQSTIDHSLPRPGSTPVTVTFKNNTQGAPSPDLPISTNTANMVESAIINSGVNSVNINSTTGGQHGRTSDHPKGKAVDIDQVNGAGVNASNSSALQNAAANEPNIKENFGPTLNTKTMSAGANSVDVSKSVAKDHQTHIHLSGQQ